MRAVLVSENLGIPGKDIADSAGAMASVTFRPHVQGIPGLPHRHPEATLVDQYATWMNGHARFGHNYIREAQLFVDLFDLTHWQLLEAKATISREAVRMALGQLRDYRRYYERRPTLAVLLPSRPSVSCINLLTDNRITAIWRTPGGSFRTKRWQELDLLKDQ